MQYSPVQHSYDGAGLGAKIKVKRHPDGTRFWSISSESCVKVAVKCVEEKLKREGGKGVSHLKNMMECNLLARILQIPVLSNSSELID